MRQLCLLALFILSAFAAPLPRADADTVFHFISESGDYIGQGQTRTFTPAGGYTISSSGTANHVSIGIDGNISTGGFASYIVSFSSSDGSPLTVADYPNAQRDAFHGAGHPGLDFFGNGNGSNTLTGEFRILEITFDASGNLATFAADFVQHSEGASPACYGQVRINSSIPYLHPGGTTQFATNAYGIVGDNGSLSLSVTRRGGSAGAVSANYATSDGTDLAGRDYTASSGTLTWADGDTADKTFTIPILNSGNPFQGNGTFLVNLSGANTDLQTQAVVTVVNDTSAVTYVHFISDPGDFIGQGEERIFNIANGYVFTQQTSYGGGVTYDFNGPEYWSASFGAPTGGVFDVGNYPQAERYGFNDPGFAGLDISGDGRGSNMVTGNFQVLELAYDDNGNVARFAANFEQHSEGGNAALHGEIRINSIVPPPMPTVSVAAKTAEAHEKGQVPGVFVVTRSGSRANPMTVTYKLAGSAVNGHDYQTLQHTKVIKAGKASVKIKVLPIDLGATSGSRTVKLKVLSPDGSYAVSVDNNIAKIKILRDDPTFTGSNPQ